MPRAYLCFIGKHFLGETLFPTRVCLALDDRQYCRSCPSPEMPISHRCLPPSRLVVMHASLKPKESIDTHSEPLQRVNSMENVNFEVEELADFCGAGTLQVSSLSCCRHHPCMQYFSIYAFLRPRDTRTQVMQHSYGQATNHRIESVPPRPCTI